MARHPSGYNSVTGMLTVATWNVNGIRAREGQLLSWLQLERPDVVCLQEIKAGLDRVPASLLNLEYYWSLWHGAGGYSGVALLVARSFSAAEPRFFHPPFDTEARAAAVTVGPLTLASLYVPNGGKDYPAKLRFLDALVDYVDAAHAAGSRLVLCGDLNVTRSDLDVHPKERKPRAIGQLPDERARIEHLLERGLTDVARRLAPDDDQIFTWWAPWRNLRQRNIGWRIDYVLASSPVGERAIACEVRRDVGTSDHAPVVATFELDLG